MKEQLYTIPVNEAFDNKCVCPVCVMYHRIEEGALDFTMGPSYMEDDVRMVTDRVGFCERHIEKMYKRGNRLGMALMLKTHADRLLSDAEKDIKHIKVQKNRKSGNTCSLSETLSDTENACFVCNRMNSVFDRYIETVFYLYDTENDFREKFRAAHGICNKHMRLLLNMAPEYLNKNVTSDFAADVSKVYMRGFEEIRDDLSWFIDKFDYRNADADWKNSKDALQRMMLQLDSVYYDPDET